MISKKSKNIDFLNPKDGNLDYCMISGSTNLKDVIDLGDQPLCDSLLSNLNKDIKNEKFFPLKLKANYELGCSQLNYIVLGNEVYHPDYPYDLESQKKLLNTIVIKPKITLKHIKSRAMI